MKRSSRQHVRAGHRPGQASSIKPKSIENHAHAMADHHHQEWQIELMSDQPNWTYLLGIHLRLIELEQLQSAVQELL